MAIIFRLLFPVLLLTSCSNPQLQKEFNKLKAENDSIKAKLEAINYSDNTSDITFVQLVKFKSTLPDSEVVKIINERKLIFQNLPGLVQKYYMKEKSTGEYSGIYFWASEQDYLNFRQSEFGKSLGSAYKVDGKPRLELFEFLFPLREK